MLITILTLFPEIFSPVFHSSIIARAQKKGMVKIQTVNIRNFASDSHRTVDDKPFGGGVGMVMRVDIVHKAIQSVIQYDENSREKMRKRKIILLDPKGTVYKQSTARRFSTVDHLVLVCGHYEGIDERITHFVDESVSVGKFILTGGEIPAMVIADSVIRLLPGVLAKKDAIRFESFSKGREFDWPQYTRPRIYNGYSVPDVLLSGNPALIEKWRKDVCSSLK